MIIKKTSLNRVCVASLATAFVLLAMDVPGKDNAGTRQKQNITGKGIDAVLFLAPVEGVFNLQAGTLETRFCLDYSFDDYLKPELSSVSPFTFFRIHPKLGTPQNKNVIHPYISIYMQQSQGSHVIHFGNNCYYKDTKSEPYRAYTLPIYSNKDKGPWLLRSEWHALATTWKLEGDSLFLEMFLDGKSCSKGCFTNKVSGILPLSNAYLFGIGGYGLSPATLLSYRLSNRVRTAEEIAAQGPLKPDEATTFFLNGETAGTFSIMDRNTFDEMSKSGKGLIRKGTFIGKYKIIDTKNGKAIQFYNQLSR